MKLPAVAIATAFALGYRVKFLARDCEICNATSPQQEHLEALAASKGATVLHELRGGGFDFDGAPGNFLWPQIAPIFVAIPAAAPDRLRSQDSHVANRRERAIHILTDGKKLEVSCFIACPEINAQINSPKPQTPDNQQASQ
jgi:hypothetical protein